MNVLSIFDTHLTVNNTPFHFFWLRDNCPCSECLHPSGQRLQEVINLNLDIEIIDARYDNDQLFVEWQDGHQSIYPDSLLFPSEAVNLSSDTDEGITLWGSQLDQAAFSIDYRDLDKPESKYQWLNHVNTHGIAFLHHVPNQDQQLLEVVDKFGYVRETNYGKYFEVITKDNPENLAFTPKPLSLHTDNPYRHPVPSLQLLHCLVAAPEGGITALADGFYAAQIVKERYKHHFDILNSAILSYRFKSTEADLQSCGSVIETDSQGKVTKVRLNNRSIQTIRLPFDEQRAFYEAYQCFMAVLHSEECKFTCKLQPGELMMFDNERVLHGREVSAIGERHLQGCYADKDSLLSTMRTIQGER